MTEIKTTSRPVLRRMLRDCDRKLESWDRTWKHYPGLSLHEARYLDALGGGVVAWVLPVPASVSGRSPLFEGLLYA